MSEISIKDAEKFAMSILKEYGNVNPVILLPNGIIPLTYTNEKTKESMIQTLREMIPKSKLDIYWHVSSGWASKALFTMPKNASDKKEALIISEFKRDGSSKCIFIYYEYKDKKLKLGERHDMNDFNSRWNFFLEDTMDEVTEKHEVEETIKMIEDTSLDKLYEIVKVRYPQMTKEKLKKTIHKLVRDGKIRPTPDSYIKYKKEKEKNE